MMYQCVRMLFRLPHVRQSQVASGHVGMLRALLRRVPHPWRGKPPRQQPLTTHAAREGSRLGRPWALQPPIGWLQCALES